MHVKIAPAKVSERIRSGFLKAYKISMIYIDVKIA